MGKGEKGMNSDIHLLQLGEGFASRRSSHASQPASKESSTQKKKSPTVQTFNVNNASRTSKDPKKNIFLQSPYLFVPVKEIRMNRSIKNRRKDLKTNKVIEKCHDFIIERPKKSTENPPEKSRRKEDSFEGGSKEPTSSRPLAAAMWRRERRS